MGDAPIARVEAAVEAVAHLPERLQDMLVHAISLIGVKYKFGGNSAQSGFDCSGFVRHVFAESIALDLPRNAYAMGKLGARVEPDDLRPGDLVFYNTLRRSFSHVGIYLGEGRFVHAPSRGKSVEIVDMSEGYWKKRFNGARRMVADD
jgi:cell wall-associated NlpC family hydrolase